jgi:phenylalanyl-tRNA synthetase beta chain
LPTVRINKDLLCGLIGVKLTSRQLEELAFVFKGEVESESSQELEIEFSADRPDLMCAAGLARAFKGYLGKALGSPQYQSAETDFSIKVDFDALRDKRPYIKSYFVAQLKIDDVIIRDIIGYQERLHTVLSRNRRRFAVGIHDVSGLASHKLIYSAVEPEKILFKPLDRDKLMNGREILESTDKGREYGDIISGWPAYPLLFSEKNEVLSMPPIINSSLTQVTSSTKQVLIDVTGTEPSLVDAMAQMIAFSFAEYGGCIGEVPIRGLPLRRSETHMELDTQMVNSLLGYSLDSASITQLLNRARIDASCASERTVTVKVPKYRLDILHPVDLVEEIAIMYGYDRISPQYPGHATTGYLHPITKVTRAVRDSLSSLGFVEINNPMLISKRDLEGFPEPHPLEIANPWSEDLDVVRPSLIPGLLSFVVKNQNKPKPIKVFETGPVCYTTGNNYTQCFNVAALLCDNSAPSDQIELYFNQLCLDIGVKQNFSVNSELSFMIPKRYASILLGQDNVGFIGELRADLLRAKGLVYPVALFEMAVYKPDISKLTF